LPFSPLSGSPFDPSKRVCCSRAPAHGTIAFVSGEGRDGGNDGPGLARSRPRGTVSVRWTPLVRGSDANWRALFDAADSVSEGSVVKEGGGPVWYGSTSLILLLPAGTTPEELAFLAGVAERDLHVRLRAVRHARREAAVRAPSTLGRSSCEIRVVSEPRGLRIDVDIQAPLIEGQRRRAAHQDR
jgi:hypothetical protein